MTFALLIRKIIFFYRQLKGKSTILILCFLLVGIQLYGQKPALDTSVFSAWSKVESDKISQDGRYVSYKIFNYGYMESGREELVIQAVSDRWKIVLSGFSSTVYFSPDSKNAYVLLSGDSLAIYRLGTSKVSYILNVTSLQVYGDWFIYKVKDENELLCVNKFGQNDSFLINNVNSFVFNEHNNSLIISKRNKNETVSLSWYDLKNRKEEVFWKGNNPEGFIFDNSGNRVAFLGKGDGFDGIWIYNSSENISHPLVNNIGHYTDSNFHISGIRCFSDNDEYLFFVSTPDNIPMLQQNDSTGANVTIWSYNDVMLKSESKVVGYTIPEYLYAINLAKNKIIPITSENEELNSFSGQFAVINHFSGKGDPEEKYWNPHSQIKTFLLSLSDGHRTEISIEKPFLSRGGKYLMFYDFRNRDFCTYETTSGKVVDITATIKNNINSDQFIEPNVYKSYWFDFDSAVIIFGKNDMWLVDPEGKKNPVNITNGYGVKSNIVFNPIADFSDINLKSKEPIILMGFNNLNKENGFYKIFWNERKDPEKLIMDGHVYYMPRAPIENGFDNKPIKATKANVWLIKRMSEKESPNLFTTMDFKTFNPVTNVYPEKRYNWLTTELHTWKTFNGDSSQGILYKPEDFDSNKKYPIIFHYYDQFSRNLHAYLTPGPCIGPINIPWYVSHGYLVFVPDISFKKGETGASAYNSVVSAAIYMKRQSYVDSAKMGIQGHSFGGYQTNYIITQTSIFAAACSSSGVTDVVSFAGGFSAKGSSNHWMSSGGQIGLGVRLWDDPERFIRNSPVFFLNKVTTPLLVMHTTGDKAVAYSQAFELFTGLRQFKKKVWLLIYEGENHVLRNEKNFLDYTLRQTQFFNYYLKDSEEPQWMEENND